MEATRANLPAKVAVFVALPCLAQAVGFLFWRVAGESPEALVAGCVGPLVVAAPVTLTRADRYGLTETARTLWVFVTALP